MAKKGENSYTYADLTEIEKVFSDNASYNSLFSIFYNGANKSQRLLANSIRSSILEKVAELKISRKTIESPELSKLISDYKEKSPTVSQEANLVESNTSYLKSSTRNLTKMIDAFSTNVFKYKDHQSYAYTIADKFATPEEKKILNKLTAYQALAKHYDSSKYEYTQEDIKAIESIYGKGKIPSDNEISIKEIHDGLKSAYEDTIEIPFVKSTAKTNYLKRTGWHANNIRNLAIVAASLGLSFGMAIIGGIPTTGASGLAVWNFIGGQMLPTFALGLILGSGEESIRKLITNRNFNKNIRESIRQLYPSQKEQLFKLVRNNLPNKERSLKKCIKNFKTQALNAGFDPQLVKELSKKGTFKALVAAENALGGKGIFYGATPFQKFMKHRHDAKGVRATPNVESNKELETSLTPIYSKANNLGRILGISGTKTRAKSPTTTVSPDNRQTRVAAINLAPTPIAAKEEILTFEANLDKNLIALPEKTESAIKEFIHSTKNTVKTFEFEFSESAAKMSVEISKGKARLHVLKSSAIIKDLTKEVNSVHETASHSEINSNGLKIKITKK